MMGAVKVAVSHGSIITIENGVDIDRQAAEG